jgi:ATP-dependent Lon protease
MEALSFGLEMRGPGQNVFVRGLSGSGRLSLVRQLIEEIHPTCPAVPDRCYVHDFAQPDRPRLIELPPGQGPRFEARLDAFCRFITEELVPYLASDALRARRTALDDRVQEEIRRLGKPFEDELAAAGLALVPVEVGRTVQPVILPVLDGEPAPPERFKQLRKAGRIPDAEAERIHQRIGDFAKRFQEVSEKIDEVQSRHKEALEQLVTAEARALLERELRRIEAAFPQDSVRRFLGEILDDVVEKRLRSLSETESFTRQYRVNVLCTRTDGDGCAVVIENAPTLHNLLGSIEREFQGTNALRSDHLMIRGGALLRADGGFLILEAADLLREPGAWKVLVRTLRTGKLEIVPSEMSAFWPVPLLNPEPIPVDVKVILLGDPALFYLMDAEDPDFASLFKVLADFDTTIPRDAQGARYYAGVLSRLARSESLPHFSADAVRLLVEHGARIAQRSDRLTIRFGRILDIAREAAFLHRKKDGGGVVAVDEIRDAIRRSKRRGDLPARTFRKLVEEGRIHVQLSGREAGQVNGLAVIQAGPMIYGFPTRITATVGPGTAGTISIEREAQLSGAIHTKGFYILGGLLRHLLRTQHPLAFSASIAFEQSYGGMDGDSASGAEICCLLSALTGVPLRQDVAMTGAIDQHGRILPVGAITEKIEGFFDICTEERLTGTQGVIIPTANAGDLMLRDDVVDAARAGTFHVYAVERVEEALTILTGCAVGARDGDAGYPDDTLLALAERKAYDYWRMATIGPGTARGGPGEEGSDGKGGARS